MVDGKCRESGSVGVPKPERRVAIPSLSEGFDHGMVSLLRGPTCLVVHNVDQATGSVLEKTKAFGVVKVRNPGDVVNNSFGCVLRNVVLE